MEKGFSKSSYNNPKNAKEKKKGVFVIDFEYLFLLVNLLSFMHEDNQFVVCCRTTNNGISDHIRQYPSYRLPSPSSRYEEGEEGTR